MTSVLAPAARSAIGTYLALLGTALPGACHGVYLTGSAVLDDWLPGRSDLDILTVTTRELDGTELDRLAALHAEAPQPPYLDAVYLTRERVGARPSPDGPGSPRTVEGVFNRTGYHADPVLWATLDRHGMTLSGPRAADLGAGPDPRWLREWNRANLDSYWRPWAANARTRLSARDPESLLATGIVAWGLTGPGRLHHTIATGEIISKTASADHTARRFPEYTGLLMRAKAWRLGDDTINFTAADGSATCELVDMIINEAARLP